MGQKTARSAHLVAVWFQFFPRSCCFFLIFLASQEQRRREGFETWGTGWWLSCGHWLNQLRLWLLLYILICKLHTTWPPATSCALLPCFEPLDLSFKNDSVVNPIAKRPQ